MRKTKPPVEPKSRKRLEVRKEKLREMSSKELGQVGGGYPKPTMTGNCYHP